MAGKAAARTQGSIFQRKYNRWMPKLGHAKASVAIGRSMLTVIYQVLSTGQPYVEPDSAQIHEMERKKLVRHHGKRLRELGVEEQMVNEMVEKAMAAEPPALRWGAGSNHFKKLNDILPINSVRLK